MDKILLAGPFIGEFGWELQRFAPHIIWNKTIKCSNKTKLIVCTREDRYDLYGEYADDFVPLRIEGDYVKYKGDCFRLLDYPNSEYKKLSENLCSQQSKIYNIKKHIRPILEKKAYANKNQFNQNQMCHEFKPRPKNKELVQEFVKTEKPIVVLAPRYRKGIKRNWPHWKTLYDLIEKDKFLSQYTFILCGKDPEYIKDENNRFFDINNIKLVDGSSLVGVTIEVMKSAILTVGSQSGIPNLSNLLKTPTLQWGNEKTFHQKTYNVYNTPCTFLLDKKFNIEPSRILKEMKTALKGIKK